LALGIVALSISASSMTAIRKFDLKAWNDDLHRALTGASNRRTLENFAHAGEMAKARKDPPLLMASTLLVPGYIDEQEIRSLASFLASISPEIPYSLRAYYPQFYMADLPLVPRSLAQRCLEAVGEEGLQRVRLGNAQLLGRGIEASCPAERGEV